MSDTRPAAMTVVLLLTVLLGATVAGAAHSNHSDDGATNATDEDHDGESDIPWFPIITGGLLLLAVGIMVVRRAIEARQGDGSEGETADDSSEGS